MAEHTENEATAALEHRLADLAADWRGATPAEREALAVAYAETLDALYARGWDDLLDAESMLPDAQMPAVYFARHPEAIVSDWSVSLSRPVGRRKVDAAAWTLPNPLPLHLSAADNDTAATPAYLPTYSAYDGPDGGYVAVYTRNPAVAVYAVTDDIFVAGLIRVRGRYHGRIFAPAGYAADGDITQDLDLHRLRERFFPAVTDSWFGGDTGGFFGL